MYVIVYCFQVISKIYIIIALNTYNTGDKHGHYRKHAVKSSTPRRGESLFTLKRVELLFIANKVENAKQVSRLLSILVMDGRTYAC